MHRARVVSAATGTALKVLVLASIPLLCRTAVAAPAITALLDAGSYTASVAQGSVFVVKGTGLCPAGTLYGTIPLSAAPLNNVKITFTPVAGGASTDAYMVYTYGAGNLNQLAAILPSSAAAGDYNVTVTNAGVASPAFKTTVVAHKFGIITANGSGVGRAVIQNYISPTQYDLGRYTSGTLAGFTYSPAHPGQIIVIWGTGMGPITTGDNVVPGAIDLRGSLDIQVLIDGVAYKPDLYAGRAPSLPGADEIVMTLPASVHTGCVLTLQVSVNGQLSNSAMIAIAPTNAPACVTPLFTTEQLTRLDQGGKFNVGTLGLSGGVDTHTNNGRTTVSRLDEASAVFVSFDADGLTPAVIGQTTSTPADGSCTVRRYIQPPITVVPNLPAYALLGPGTIALTGPNINKTSISVITLLNNNVAGVTATAGAVYAAGTYSVTGNGGKDVGAFQASIKMDQPLVVTGGIGTELDRSRPLVITWTGGGTSQVTIAGGSSVVLPGSTPANRMIDVGSYECITTADKGGFTVPASVLQQMPVGGGNVRLSSNYNVSTFTAPLVAGGNLDYGYFYTGFQSSFNPDYK